MELNEVQRSTFSEVQERVLCITGPELVLSCPMGSFIDMLPGGRVHTPTALFVLNFSCPTNHRAAISEAEEGCSTVTTEPLKRSVKLYQQTLC